MRPGSARADPKHRAKLLAGFKIADVDGLFGSGDVSDSPIHKSCFYTLTQFHLDSPPARRIPATTTRSSGSLAGLANGMRPMCRMETRQLPVADNMNLASQP